MFGKSIYSNITCFLGSAVFLMKNNVPHSLKSSYGHNGVQIIGWQLHQLPYNSQTQFCNTDIPLQLWLRNISSGTTDITIILCVLDRASSWYLNNGWPTWWHLLYYILLNMFQTLIRPSSGASEYLLCCVGWLEACWCYVPGLSVGGVVSECRLNNYSDTTSPTDNPGT